MKLLNLRLLAIFLFSTISYSSFSAVFTSISGGDWNSPNTWDVGNGKTPTLDDDVIILHDLFINGPGEARSLVISNSSFYLSRLIIQGSDSLVIYGDLTVTSENVNRDVIVQLMGSSNLIVEGNASFTRTNSNSTSKILQLNVSGSTKVEIKGALTFDYKSSGLLEFNPEIITSENAILDVTGTTNFTINGGLNFHTQITGNSQVILRDTLTMLLSAKNSGKIKVSENAHFQALAHVYVINSDGLGTILDPDDCKINVTADNSSYAPKATIKGNLHMTSTNNQYNDVSINSTGENASFHLEGDLIMTAANEYDVSVNIKNGSSFYLGGDIIRNTDFGKLEMDPNTRLIFNGNTPQTIPERKLGSAVSDSLFFGEIVFQNTSGAVMALTEDFVVEDTLFLNTGKIESSPSAMIVLEADAVIVGGRDSAYIIGPILKKGAAESLLLPTGTTTKYAPIGISGITDPASEITVQYYSDPPPFGTNYSLDSELNNISMIQHWTVERTSDVDDVDYTLHWMDETANGISDTSKIVVVGLEGLVYQNYSKEDITSNGTQGSVTNAYSDPPPFGTQYITIGSTEASNALPVELTKFQAVQQNQEVHLQWETASEIRTSHFEVEHSTNGDNFKSIKTVFANGNSNATQLYNTEDKFPQDGMNYYRLKMVDIDGLFDYSKVEIVNFDTEETTNIFPNPVEKEINIVGVENFGKDISIKVFDKTGRELYNGKVEIENGNFQTSTQNINVNATGTYFLQITGASKTKVLKFIKVK